MAQGGIVLRHVSKAFGGQHALRDVSVDFAPGRITALLGENGSGKSTLIKVLAGAYVPDQGEIRVHGTELEFPVDPRRINELGVRFVHQNLALVPDLTVADNLDLVDGFEPSPGWNIRRDRQHARARDALDRFGLDLSPDTRVRDLSVTERTMVAIARAMKRTDDADGTGTTLVLDEPTATLPATEVGRVLEAMRLVASSGGSVVWVTHRLDEVMQLADDVIVLREGRNVGKVKRMGLTEQALVELILGRNVSYLERPARSVPAAERAAGLEVRGLAGPTISGIDFGVAPGEIVGIAGLVGCGRSELLRILAGAQESSGGAVSLHGSELPLGSPGDLLRRGVAYVPQDRLTAGCIPELSMRVNLTLTDLSPYWRFGWLGQGAERRSVAELMERFDIRPRVTETIMSLFSGGNQQKAVLAKGLRLAPKVLLLDEPTQGVDIGARQQIFGILRDLADEGLVVVVGSTDNAELVHLCDRVIVMDRGRIVNELAGERISERQLTLLTTKVRETS